MRAKYSRGLERTNTDAYADKLRITPNLDEGISTSDNIQNEPANHKNGESFNRGKINIRIGGKDYNTDVLTAIKQDGREVFYDVVDIQPTKINAPTETAEAGTSGNRSVKANEDSRRTDTESVESSHRGLPGASNNSIAPAGASVNGNRVENSVETVKSAAETAADGTDGGNSPMRETYGMEAPKTEGQMEDVKTFDQALELAGTGSGMAANVNYVLGNLKGRNALEIAYTYGRDAAETRWANSPLADYPGYLLNYEDPNGAGRIQEIW